MNNPLKESPKRKNPLKLDVQGVQRSIMEQQGPLRARLDIQTYLDKYLPLPSQPLNLPGRVLDSLTKAGMYINNMWVGIPQQTQGGIRAVEGDIYEGFVKVLENIRDSTEKDPPNLNRIPGKWVDTHDIALQTPTGSGVSGLKPDISFVHSETDGNEVFWSRVYSVIEVKTDAGNAGALAAQLGSYVGHIFAEQVDRLFVNALTLCGHMLQIWRYDRSGCVTLDNAIDIDNDPMKFVQIVASFSYLSPTDLGWDTTCTVWNVEKRMQEPSYKLPQKVFQRCGIYELPWVFRVEKEDYVAIGPVNANRSLSIWGRATFVVHAVDLKDWKTRNDQAKVYILKQCWQRLPGLEREPPAAEIRNSDGYTSDQPDRDSLVGKFEDIDRKPFEAFIMERAGWKHRIRASWNVELDGEPITTFKTIRKNVATSIPPPSKGHTSGTGTPGGSSACKGPVETIDDAPGHPALVTRTLVRLVFDRPGWPIERFMSKLELLRSLKMIVEELQKLHENGVVHRDVSPSNLIVCESGGHIIDYDHSIVGFVNKRVAIEKTETQDVVEIAKEIFGNEWKADRYVNRLKELWGIKVRVATPEDFHWPEKIDPVYVFNNRPVGDGFITGTYEFISSALRRAPFHHGGHDLDSLWWSINIIPLRFEGPGGRERKNPPREVIEEYYGGGPENKGDLMEDLAAGSGDNLDAMMAEYSDYFKDLKPFMKKWALFLRIALHFSSFEHYHPHRYLLKIIEEAIQQMEEKEDKGEAGYEAFAAAEHTRRETEKEDMAKAIRSQVTIPNLPKFKNMALAPVGETFAITSSPNVTNSGYSSTTTAPLSPERNSVSLTTVGSPERDRAVKRARSGTYVRNVRE